LPVDYLPAIAERCRNREIELGCTPFYLNAVEELLPFVDFYKIASYELLWHELLRACAQTGKPIVLSTGMATMDEVKSAVNVLAESGCKDLTILHCVSGYPTPVSECNLSVIETLRSELCVLPAVPNASVGWSDHSVSPSVIRRAIHRWRVEMIEFHLDIDGEGAEFATGHCWLPRQMQQLIEGIQMGFEADGTGNKLPVSCEASDRDWRADPGDGLRPQKHLRDLFGKGTGTDDL
jgi:N-acetylneuraminate synthase